MAELANDSRPGEAGFAGFEKLDRSAAFSGEAFARIGALPFFTEFTREDIDALANYMAAYRARPGQVVIEEDAPGDFMLLVIEGAMDILKKGERGEPRHIASVGPGMTLGEMSMIDGEPRFATCVATTTTVFGVVTRDAMAKILLDRPELGTKMLVKLVTLMSLRLRQTSTRLLHLLDGSR